MGKALIIAEKPSVAAELSKALAKAPEMSKFKKHKEKDYFENETHIIAAAVGHLVELPLPTEGGKKMKWDLEKLPILPEKFALKPIDKPAPAPVVKPSRVRAADSTSHDQLDTGRRHRRYLVHRAEH